MLAIANAAIGPKLSRRIDGEDIVQSVALKAWMNLEHFEGNDESDWKAWLAAILKSEIQQMIRTHIGTLRRSLRCEVPEPRLSGSGPADYGPVAPDTSPSGRASRNEEMANLESSLTQLPSHEEEVVRLQRLDQMTILEIADSLGKRPGAVAGLLARGVQRLRGLMQQRPPRRIDDEPTA